MTDKEKELIEKINRLAKDGVGGEKINAEKKLKALMEKFGITEEDLESNRKYIYYYKVPNKNTIYYRLFIQIVANFNNKIRTTAVERHIMGIELTPEENIELSARIDFYFSCYKKDEEYFFRAFVHKNDLYSGVDTETKATEEVINEMLKVMQISEGLEKHNLAKQIELKG